MDDKSFDKTIGKIAANALTFGIGGPVALAGKVFVEYCVRAVLSDADKPKDDDEKKKRDD